MAFFLHLLALLTAVIASCIAEIISLRSPAPNLPALSDRTLESPADYFISPSSSDGNSDLTGDLDLLDVVLVASVDGKFHALNRTSGHTLWSMSSYASSTSVPTPPALNPLVRTQHIDYDPDLTDESTNQELYVIEPQSGDIYVMATPNSPLQRFPFSMSELVDLSPFSFSADKDGRVFVGKKETSLLLMELETGRIKATLNSECPWEAFENLEDNELDLDELEGEHMSVSSPTEVFIGRTDYHISVYKHSKKSNPGLPRSPIQNLSFSTYGPNNRYSHFQAAYKRTKDNAYIQSLPNGDVISFKARPKGSTPNNESPLLWGRTFPDPIVAVFDVLRSTQSQSGSHNPFVLLQPRPQLQEVLPTLTLDVAATHLNLQSAYVGMVRGSGSLFVMSPSRFPLVAFGGADRNAKQRLIDAGENSGNDLPVEVDAITRARQERERIEAWERTNCEQGTYTDRRCLVGIRRLEDEDGPESRMRRLLDGPAGSAVSLPSSSSLDTLPSPTQDASPAVSTTGVPGERWTKAAKGNVWEGLAFAFVLGVVSLWFAVRRRTPSRTTKYSLLKEDMSQNVPSALSEGSETEVAPSPRLDVVDEGPSVQEKADSPLPSSDPHQTPTAAKAPGQDSAVDDGDDSDKDVGAEADTAATPGRRKARRGKRGKKKKLGLQQVDNENEDEKLLNANGNESGSGNDAETPSKELQPLQSSSSLIINSLKPPQSIPSLVVSETVLGFGSHGTVVFQGSLQGRAVAVKRLLQDFVTLAEREVSILQESDDHPNVIRYYYQESQGNFLYIALELCPASLADIIENPNRDQWRDIAISFDPKKALRQITSGLRHLHALKLVHRDIKPQNILISSAKPSAGNRGKPTYRMLISDFGLCKKLEVDQTSFLPTTNGAMAAGTVGWRAPEILRGEVKLDEIGDDSSMSSRGSVGTVVGTPTTASTPSGKPTRLTKSIDIFALGCLFYYVLTNGSHPFGDRFEREVNILKNSKNLDGLERFGEEGAEAVDLISSMLDPEASERPDTTTCLLHPFFWDPGRRLNFLQDASDRFEIMCRDPKDQLLLLLERGATNVVGNDWYARLDKLFIENLGKFRKYDGRTVQDLLRALRNKKHHYQDLPDNVKRHLGPMPEGFLAYFTRRYPRLFLHVHSIIGSTNLRSESMFRSYFELPPD